MINVTQNPNWTGVATVPHVDRNGSEFPELLTAKQWTQVTQTYNLTKCETKLLRLLARGYANGELAGELEICHPTVRSHLRSLYRKLNERDRVSVILRLVHDFR